VPQTINAASFAIVEALRKAHALEKVIPGAADIAFGTHTSSVHSLSFSRKPADLGFPTEQLRELHVGQSHDLHWTRHASIPTEEEYLDMVSKSTSNIRGFA
jgi:geranylgeranyl pyrophosphate synthase